MQRYYPLRRVPHTVPRSYLWRRLTPLVPHLARSAGRSVAAALPLPANAREAMQEKARAAGDETVEKAQHIFFENPGLDTLVVRVLNRIGRTVVELARLSLAGRIALGLDREGRLRTHLEALPSTGYDSLMVSGLAAGTALGYFRGGDIQSLIWWDSADKNSRKRTKLPKGHPYPAARRFQVPRSLGDLAADIDDLYWAEAYGQAMKVTRVGEGENRRWLVSLPGTDHGELESEPNPADIESNIREELNLPSAMRRGAIQVIKSAMAADGLTPEEMVSERVLICGHSQGGMVAVGLAASDPEEVGFTVDRVLTMGSPTRRLRLRSDAQLLAVEHVQDIVPSLDGTPRRQVDQRIVVDRELNKPKQGPLFYAHSSSTYTETVRQLEREATVVGWGRTGDVVGALRDYLPQPGEPWRVTHHYVWQDLLEPQKSSAWTTYLEMDLPHDWCPVTFEGEIGPGELRIPEPPISIPTVEEIQSRVTALLHAGGASRGDASSGDHGDDHSDVNGDSDGDGGADSSEQPGERTNEQPGEQPSEEIGGEETQ